MKGLCINIISFFLVFSTSSCIFIHDQGYKGLTTTTLAGHIVLNNSNCFVTSENREPEANEKIISAVINLETSGDKYVTLCLTESNYGYFDGSYLLKDLPLNFQNLKLTFYASDTIADPGGQIIGDASEVLLFGISPVNQYQIAEFELLPPPQSCETYFGGELRPGFLLGELDLTLLHKKPFIIARVADCGNFPLGTATNPLISEKNLPK